MRQAGDASWRTSQVSDPHAEKQAGGCLDSGAAPGNRHAGGNRVRELRGVELRGGDGATRRASTGKQGMGSVDWPR